MKINRRKTTQLSVGKVGVGSDFPISVQSMTTTKTKDVESTLSQIYEIASNCADIIRVTCNEVDAAKGLVENTQRSPVPIVADIHFQYKLALAAIDAGVDGLRLNPGNIRKEQQIKEVAKEALSASIPIGILDISIDFVLYTFILGLMGVLNLFIMVLSPAHFFGNFHLVTL